jgi:CubicO group peptidase (beta-lactamase class C family)
MQKESTLRSFKKATALFSIMLCAFLLGLWKWQARSTDRYDLRDSASDAKAPPTPAGRSLATYLKSLNTGDFDIIRRFISEDFSRSSLARISVDERATNDALLYRETQGLDLFSIEQSTDYLITAITQARLSEAWFRISLEVAPEEPHEITSLRINLASRPAGAPANKKLADAEIVREVETYINKLAAADTFSGAVLLAKSGKPLFARAYGIANRRSNAANQIDTLFNIGSMNKMFTAVAIAQLAERGKLSFDDTIAKHILEYPNKDVAKKVKISHLLTHTSGMGDFFNSRLEASRTRLREIEDFIPLFVDEPLSFEPGTRFQYSNAGYIVLGWIVEKVSNQNYFRYVKEHIYKQAGMNNTDAYEAHEDFPNMAVGYTQARPDGRHSLGLRMDNLSLHLVRGTPAGGGFSTVEDLLKFDIALRNYKLLTPKNTAIILAGKVQTDSNPEAKYAFGFRERRVNGSQIVGHGGGFPGINAQLDMYLDSGYTVAVATNYDPPAATVMAEKLCELLTRK